MAKKGAVLGLFALLVIIIGIALAVYFSTKKSGEETSDKPEITLDAASKNLNPRGDGTDEDATVDTSEGYKIEYATGDDSGNESIDLKITWTTGMGFDTVSKLIFRREIGGNKVQEDIVYDSGSGIENNSNGEITFKGTELTDSSKSVVGVNKVSVWYNSVSDDAGIARTAAESTFLVDTGDQIKIEQSDIDTTLNLTEVQEVTIPITIASDSFKFEILGKETLYLIEEFHLCFKMKNLDGGKVQFINLITGNADKLWDNTDAYRLKKYKDGYMLGHPDNNRKEVLVRKVLTKDDIDFGDGKFINHKPTFKKLNEMNKDEYARALFHLEPVRTAIRSDQNDGKMGSGAEYLSPNGAFTFKQHPNMISLHIHDNIQRSDVWASAKAPEFNKPCDTARIQGDGNFIMKVTGSSDDWGYRSDTSQWGTGNGPYRVVVGDNATVAIVKKDGRVIHYVFRAKPISIAMGGGGVPKWYSWTKPAERFKHNGLAHIHENWYKKCEIVSGQERCETGVIKLDNDRHAKDWGYKWVAFTLVHGNAGHHYGVFGVHSTYGKDFVYLPDGACDIQSNHKRVKGAGVITGQKSNSSASTSYKGPEHTKLGGYDTWKIYYIPSLPLEGYVNRSNLHDIIQPSVDQIKEEHFGVEHCRTRANEFDGTNAFVYRSYRSDTDGWTHTCAPVKLFNVNNLKGNVVYEANPAHHETGCTNPLKNARTGCTTAIDVPERGGTHKGSVR
jgi:hypothetical protein